MSITKYIFMIFFCYVSYFWISLEAWKRDAEKLFCKRITIVNMPILNYKYLSGILLLGVVPLVLTPRSSLSFMTVSARFNPHNITSFIFLLVLSFLMAAQLSETKKRQLQNHSNQEPARGSDFTLYLVIRITYLVCYELFFRGVLLFGSVALLGKILAVLVNVLLSAMMHAYSAREEMFARVPFGMALCWVSLSFSSVWPAIVAHLLLSLVYEIRLYKHYFLPKNSLKS